jgi:DNA-binding beta-propeller fold protein YncE
MTKYVQSKPRPRPKIDFVNCGLFQLFMKPTSPFSIVSVGLLVALCGGCAARKPASQNHIFFPGPPDEPHIQYLMSYGSETDLGGKGRFSDFVVGSDNVYRPIIKPYGIAINQGKVYVCDTQARNVSIADIQKGRLHYLKPTGQAALSLPINVAVDKDGTTYVTDTGRNQVLIYDKQGNYLAELGKKNEMKPCGIALAADRIYVSDLANRCVRVYHKVNRELLFTFPRNATNDQAKLFGPTNLGIDSGGNIYVSDSAGFAVKIYDREGNYVRTLGELGVTPGQFALPKGIGVDREGRTYVLDAAAPVVQLFDKEGHLLMWFGEPKSSGPASLYLPAGLTIDYDNVALFQKYVAPGHKLDYVILLTNQIGRRKVSVYGFLRKS